MSGGLWYCGVGPTTRRDVDRPRTWIGLSGADHERLVRFLEAVGRRPDELHTHVPVGRIEGLDELGGDDPYRNVLLGRWPYRIDAVLRYGRRLWLVECKGELTHQVLGQVLCYWFWWCRDVPDRQLTRAVVVCESADVDVVPVAEWLGVDVCVLPSEKGGEAPPVG